MKSFTSRLTLLFLTMILIGCSEKINQKNIASISYDEFQSCEPVCEMVNRYFPEVEGFEYLKKSIDNDYQPRPINELHRIIPVDINTDDITDYVVIFNSAGFSGSGGYTARVLLSQKEDYRVVELFEKHLVFGHNFGRYKDTVVVDGNGDGVYVYVE